MFRLFVALPLPPGIADRLQMLTGGVPGARWVARENYHVTLRFIGETPGDRIEDVDDALRAIQAPRFELALDGVGRFGDRGRTRALWAGVARSDALRHLQARVEAAVQRAGFPAEERRFTPHVTLARVRETQESRVVAFLEQRAAFLTPTFEIDRFALYRSHLGQGGPVYEELASYPLAEAGRPSAQA